MKAKTLAGWIGLILIALTPVFLLFYLGPSTSDITTFPEITHKLGQLCGLMGMTLFALTFLLSTRWDFIENIFGGLDKVYKVHGAVGGTALALILFHPILLVLKFIPSNIKLAGYYLLPSQYMSTNFGIIALLSMIGLIYFTLYTKIKYNKWKFSHKFLGLVFLFAMLHIFLIRDSGARDYIFNGYYVYASVVSFIGLLGFTYSLFLKNNFLKEAIYKIESINVKNNVYEFTFAPQNKPLSYVSGQFIFVRFYNEKLSKESHPFSIASKSNDPKVKIIIKSLGDFTSNLNNAKVGDKVALEGPYGRFNMDKDKSSDQVWVAGGIGITPFMGMSQDLKDKKIPNIYLFYSVKTEDEFIGLKHFQELSSANPNFKVIPWVSSTKGYLTLESIKKVTDIKNKDFYLCGPLSFKKSIKNSLIKSGIDKDNIYEEEFDFR